MEDEKQVPNGYGSVYPNSYWSGIPTPTETLINKIISIFK